MNQSLKVYFAGELFSSKHLFGNAILAEAIWELSKGRFHCLLPQNLEKRFDSPHAIRDEDIKSVISADIGLFNYDGPELDSGTVVEYLFSKFADIPSVILRTDFRSGGDQKSDHAWNLMTSFFPRTEVVIVDAMALYKEALFLHSDTHSAICLQERKISRSAAQMIREIAKKVIDAMERVSQAPPIMPEEMREIIYQWLAMLPGFKQDHEEIKETLTQALKRKMQKNLI